MNPKYAQRREAGPNPQDAFRTLVYSQPSVQELAAKMGYRPGTLYNKADADRDSHNKPTLEDVVHITQITGDMRVVDSLCALFGHVAFDCTARAGASDAALLELVTKLGAEHGEFHTALGQALAGERFTTDKLNRVRAEAFDTIEALMTLVVRLEALIDKRPAAQEEASRG
jgi:hypothetical protein